MVFVAVKVLGDDEAPEVMADPEILGDADAAVHLDGLPADQPCRAGTDHLRGRNRAHAFQRLAIHGHGGGFDDPSGFLERDEHVDGPVLQSLEGERLPELLAGAQMGEGVVEEHLHGADRVSHGEEGAAIQGGVDRFRRIRHDAGRGVEPRLAQMQLDEQPPIE